MYRSLCAIQSLSGSPFMSFFRERKMEAPCECALVADGMAIAKRKGNFIESFIFNGASICQMLY